MDRDNILQSLIMLMITVYLLALAVVPTKKMRKIATKLTMQLHGRIVESQTFSESIFKSSRYGFEILHSASASRSSSFGFLSPLIYNVENDKNC
jgi:hypothetical protein